MGAKKFSYQAFDAVALNSPTDLATNGKSKASEAVRSMQYNNDKAGRMTALPALANPLKISRISQAALFGEYRAAGAHGHSI